MQKKTKTLNFKKLPLLPKLIIQSTSLNNYEIQSLIFILLTIHNFFKIHFHKFLNAVLPFFFFLLLLENFKKCY